MPVTTRSMTTLSSNVKLTSEDIEIAKILLTLSIPKFNKSNVNQSPRYNLRSKKQYLDN